MSQQDFLEEFADVFDISKAAMTESFAFESPEVWDSLAIISTIALVDEHFGVILKASDLVSCPNVVGLLKVIESKSSK